MASIRVLSENAQLLSTKSTIIKSIHYADIVTIVFLIVIDAFLATQNSNVETGF